MLATAAATRIVQMRRKAASSPGGACLGLLSRAIWNVVKCGESNVPRSVAARPFTKLGVGLFFFCSNALFNCVSPL